MRIWVRIVNNVKGIYKGGQNTKFFKTIVIIINDVNGVGIYWIAIDYGDDMWWIKCEFWCWYWWVNI